MIPPRPRDPIELTTRDVRVVKAPADEVASSVQVVVGVTATQPGPALARCLESVADQGPEDLALGVVVLLDGLELENAAAVLKLPAGLEGRAWVLMANCGSAARSRNTILEFVDERVVAARWVARLDDDDTFATPGSLSGAVALGNRSRATAVLGGNRVLDRTGALVRLNPATQDLLHPRKLLELLAAMAEGRAFNELPSCNLLLRSRSGFRYPDRASGEDHWLVASLLVNHASEVVILESPLYADYTIDGGATVAAKSDERYLDARRSLHDAASSWVRVRGLPGRLLGYGQEAIVREHEGRVFKHYYPGILSAEKAAWLASTLPGTTAIPAPELRFDSDNGGWVASYPCEETEAFTRVDPAAVRAFLSECLRCGVVCTNIKRSNFRVRPSGELVFVDVGNSIIPMDVSYFRDASARLYAIGVLGWSDFEVLRRRGDHTRPEIWERLPGFSGFYGDLIEGWIQAAWSTAPALRLSRSNEGCPEVTLLIKACAMDARYAREQIVHIVDQLSAPRAFAERVLLVDPYTGPFLRQHDAGDLKGLLETARKLVEAGVLDRVIVGPSEEGEIRRVNARWFSVDCAHTHSNDDVPVTPQVWAFDEIATRFVLQCDLDVLIGRRRRDHDYLAEMLEACRPDDVVCVAFNIPFPVEDGNRPYGAPVGEYKPEVRLGLLDLQRLRALRPLPATVVGHRLATTWYRALHAAQRARGLRTVRGGHSDTFYLHPPNSRKGERATLGRIRDLVAQGRVPVAQVRRWDLEVPDPDWAYPTRSEPVVVLARGRNTPPEKIERFAASLAMQDDQSFGVIVIDDASEDVRPSHLVDALGWLGDRLTLVRHPERVGHTRNNMLGIGALCEDPATMILVLDLDDALADRSAVRVVRELAAHGHDVVLAAPFRPDAPTKVYRPCFDKPRETFGGDVWIHLRAFAKRLFDALPERALKLDGAWIDEQEDYATMVPIVELATSPFYLPRYLCWHERATLLDEEGRRRRDERILRILRMEPLKGGRR